MSQNALLQPIVPPSTLPLEHPHAVQFYDDDRALVQTVAAFLTDALVQGGRGIMIGTRPHRDGVRRALGRSAARNVLFLDAAQVLEAFMVDGRPDAARFEAAVAPVLARAQEGGGPVAAFGEMVALLVADGDTEAALRLERLWDEWIVEHRFRLLCAYPLDLFGANEDGNRFLRVCDAHPQVLHPSGPPGMDAGRFAAVLHQRARALETEMARGEDLQHQLVEREDGVRALLEDMAQPLHHVGRDGHILWANEAELRMLGYAREQYVGHRIDRFHADPGAAQEVLSALLGQRLQEHYVRLRCRDGTVRHVLMSAQPQLEVEGAMCASRDITPRFVLHDVRHLEESREAQRERLHRHVEALAQEVLHGGPLPVLLQAGARRVAKALGHPWSQVLRTLPGGTQALLVAAVGWPEDAVGQARLDLTTGSQLEHTFLAQQVVVVDDLLEEQRFHGTGLPQDARAGLSVVLEDGAGRAWGLLVTHGPQPRAFSDDEVRFLRSTASVLGLAIELDAHRRPAGT